MDVAKKKKYFESDYAFNKYCELVEENMEYFVDYFMANGVLEDRVMDERGVPKAEDEVNNKDRDDRVPRSNRSKMLAGQEFLIYFKNKREEKNAMKLLKHDKKRRKKSIYPKK